MIDLQPPSPERSPALNEFQEQQFFFELEFENIEDIHLHEEDEDVSPPAPPSPEPAPAVNAINEPRFFMDFDEEDEELEDVELQELPDKIYNDEEIDDPNYPVQNLIENFISFAQQCREKGHSVYSQSDVYFTLDLEDPEAHDDDVFTEDCHFLSIFPIEASACCRPRIHFPSTEFDDIEQVQERSTKRY